MLAVVSFAQWRCARLLLLFAFSVFGTCLVSAAKSTSQGAVGLAAPQKQVLQVLERHNFLLGVAQVGRHYENGTQCGKELESLLKAAAKKEFWSIKVLDSFGAAPSSFGWGNYFWFSASELCEHLNAPYRISLAHAKYNNFNTTSPFPLRFTVVYMNFSTPHYIDLKLVFQDLIHVGLCLPASCDAPSLKHFTHEYFQQSRFELQRAFSLSMQAVDVRIPAFHWSFFTQTGSILFISITLLIILLSILAEMLNRTRENLKFQKVKHTKFSTTTTPMHNAATATTTPAEIKFEEKSATIERLVLCFDMRENYKRAIKLDSANNFLSVIAGVRTITCLWITVFHVYYYSIFALANVPLMFAKLEYFIYQPILQACYFVDVFFVISAFLLVYNFLSNESQLKQIRHNGVLQNLKLYAKNVLYRYMRLTPVLIITMLLSDMLYDFVNMYTPFRLGVHSGIYCKRNWWHNLLYVQNFLDMRDICCSWTWYLACEMQFFIVFTALLFVHARNPKAAKIAFATLALGFVVAGWLCNYRNGITFEIDVIYGTLNQLYTKPWVRINPYMGGAVGGWLLQRHQHHQRRHQTEAVSGSHGTAAGIKLHAVGRAAFWLCCLCLYVSANFMSYWRSTPTWLVASIMSLGKLMCALCFGVVIVLCARGQGGLYNSLLSARVFLALNKFCFSIYMVAPVIIFGAFGLRSVATNFTEVGSGTDFFGIVALSIAAAFLYVLLVELPMQRISNAFLRPSWRMKQRSSAGVHGAMTKA